MTKQERLFESLATIAVVLLAIGTIFVLGMITEKNINQQTKYEYYLNGEQGYSYHCEVKEKVQCEVDGNMIEVSQFSEVEK